MTDHIFRHNSAVSLSARSQISSEGRSAFLNGAESRS